MAMRNVGCFLRLLLFKSVNLLFAKYRKEQRWPGWVGHCFSKGVLQLNALGWPFFAPGQKIRAILTDVVEAKLVTVRV